MRKHIRNPRIYALARRSLLVGQFLARRPDEPDLKGFKFLRNRKSGIVIDIGANGGQSAVALAFILPNFRILSFEPNPALWPELDFIGRLIGDRFSYRRLGLGASDDKLIMYIPQLDDFPITTRASLSRKIAEQHCSALGKELGSSLSVVETTVDVVTFDSLDLDPAAVKIDVEGFELEVLQGMRQTLARARPVVMLESNAHNEQCAELLHRYGYEICYRDRETDVLTSIPTSAARNWFGVPSELVATVNR